MSRSSHFKLGVPGPGKGFSNGWTFLEQLCQNDRYMMFYMIDTQMLWGP